MAFNNISSAECLDDLMNTMLKIKPDTSLYCLELIFTKSMVPNLSPSVLNPLKALLKQKQLNYVAIVDFYSSSPLRSALPVLFSEKEFQYQHEISGTKREHSTSSRQDYECYLYTRDRFVINLKHNFVTRL